MTAPTTPEQAAFHEWFEREFPVVNGTRERYLATMMMDLMFEAWIGGQASAALAEPVAPWVRVSERLPDVGVDVLAGNAYCVREAAYCGHNHGWIATNGEMFRDCITHWKPLPAGPVEQGEQG